VVERSAALLADLRQAGLAHVRCEGTDGGREDEERASDLVSERRPSYVISGTVAPADGRFGRDPLTGPGANDKMITHPGGVRLARPAWLLVGRNLKCSGAGNDDMEMEMGMDMGNARAAYH